MQTLDITLEERILWVKLNRPDQLNAFTTIMQRELEDTFNSASLDDDVGAIIVTGNGRAFCAGMDLSSPGNAFGLDETLRPTLADLNENFDDPQITAKVRDTGGRLTLAIHRCRKPVIAAINGPAVGIGATMTLAMDFRLASETARLGFVFARLGIVPEACSSWFLPRLVGLQQAMEWSLTGDIFDAETALSAGLLRSVHSPDQLLDEAKALALRLITNRSAAAIAITRQMLRRNPGLSDPVEAHKIESLAMFYSSIGDGKEGVSSFIEKRLPNFTSKASSLPEFAETWLE